MRPRKRDKHLPPCVYHQHGAYYLVRDGKWIPLGKDLSAALAEYGRLHEAKPGSMPALINRVYAHIRPSLSASTARQYGYAAAKLRTILRDFEPHQVKPRHVAAIKMSLSAKPNMANRVLSFLRTVFSCALEWQLVDSNPCTGIKRHTENKRDRYITDQELAAIYAQAKPRLQVIIDLLYLTGQRINDVLKIRHADLAPEGLMFKPSKTSKSTKAKLCIAWNDDLRAVVERAKTLRGNVMGLTLLHGRTGKAPDYRTVVLEWHKACEAAGVQDATPHDIRAKALTDLEAQGGDPQALGTHASRAMTERYLRLHATPVVSGPAYRRKSEAAE